MGIDLNDLTVVLPTRNESRNIRNFLSSLPEDVSLVVIDASEDSTAEIVSSLRPDYTKVIMHPGSVTEARRIGGFDIGLSCNEDSELAWRITRKGYKSCFTFDLVVYAGDHRRLERGMIRKTLHSITGCSALYFNLIPDRWKGSDWGYWSHMNTNRELQNGN